jgi:hypothetical protein
MKNLKDIISEKLIINKNIKVNEYHYHPINRRDLVEVVSKKYKDLKSKNEILDLNDIDISKVHDLSYLFELIKPKKVNMNNWDTSNVTDIHGLFWNNDIIEEIYIEDWDVSNVETAYGSFYFCKNLKKLNLKSWNFKSCTEFDLMFKGCEQLDTKFTDTWKMPTHVITVDQMFDGCKYRPKWYKEL